MHQNIAQTLKEKIGIVELVRYCGYEPNKENKITSIYKPEEKTPSLQLNLKGPKNPEDYYYCFSTGESGDIFKFYGDLHHLDTKNDFNKILQELTQIFNISIDTNLMKQPLIKPKILESEIKLPNLPTFYDLSKENQAILKSKRNIDYNDLNAEQKRIIKQDNKKVICLLYIYNNQTQFYQRWLPDTNNKYMSGKDTTPKASFNLGGLNTIKHNEDLWIVEGFFDMICMQLSGFNCVASYNANGGTSEIANFINQHYTAFKNIYIALDNDSAGQEGCNQIIKKLDNLVLKNRVYKAYLINNTKDKKQDVNDFFRENKLKKTHFVKTLIESRLDEETLEKENIKFYNLTEKGSVIINQRPLGLFLEYLGFRNLKIAPDTYKVVRVVDNRYRYTDETEIMDIIESKVLQLPDGDLVFNKLFNGSNIYLRFNSSSIKYLKKIDNQQDDDTLYTSKIYYKNGYLLIEKDSISLKDYSQLDKPIFEEDIKNFDFDESYLEKTKTGEFEKFAYLTQNNNQDRISKLRSTLGYLCHRYDNSSHKKAVIFTDGHGELDVNSGGSGKSVMAKSVRFIRNLVIEDGKKFNSDERFAYQKMTSKTEILYLDDIKARFELEYLFSCITEGFTVEQKNKQAFTVIAKLLLSSNKPMKINYKDGSTIRRIIEVEFGDYFHGSLTINGLLKPEHTPLIEFGHNLFDEWNAEEWQLFYVYMAQNIQLYFNQGIVTVEADGIKQRRLQNSINGDKSERPLLYEFFENNLIVENRPFRGIIKPKDLMSQYFVYIKENYENTGEIVRQRGFTEKLKEYLDGKAIAYEQEKDMHGIYFKT